MSVSRARRAVLAWLAVAVLLAGAGGWLVVAVAESRALDAERTHVAGRLDDASCLADWGTDEGAGPRRRASVTGASGVGLRVAVTLPYAYTTTVDGDRVFADAASEAVYRVTPWGTRRVAGDDVEPC